MCWLAQSHEHMAKTQENVVRSKDNMVQALNQLALVMEKSHITLLGGEESDMDSPMHEDVKGNVEGGGSTGTESEEGSTSGTGTKEEGAEEVEMVGRRSKKRKKNGTLREREEETEGGNR